VHHKKVPVFFPLGFVFNQSQGMKGVAEIGLDRFFKPVDIFHCVIGVLNVMKVKEAVVLFLVGYKVSVQDACRDKDEQNSDGKNLCRKKTVFHFLNIGIFLLTPHSCLWNHLPVQMLYKNRGIL
jgi:hypothetical protein